MAKPKTVQVGNTTVTQISQKEWEILVQKIKKRHDRLCAA
jgi:hypothetical protein